MTTRLKQLISWLRARSKQIHDWVKLWPDVLLLVAGIALFILTAPIFSWMAGMIGGPESGLLNNFIIVAIEISLINALIFLGVKFNFPIIFDWYKKPHTLPNDWFNLSPWQRFLTFLVLYTSLFLAGVLLMSSLQ